MKRLWAIVFFGWTGIKLLFKRILLRTNQEELFRSEFSEEKIFPLKPETRAEYNTYSKCVNCGYCDLFLPLNHDGWNTPDILFNSLSTNLPDVMLKNPAPLTLDNFKCPAHAPYNDLIEFLKS